MIYMSTKKPSKRSESRNGVLRLILTLLAILVQVTWLLVAMIRLNEYYSWIGLGTRVLAIILAITISGRRQNYSLKLLWIVLILTVPIVGIMMYGLVTLTEQRNPLRKKYDEIDKELLKLLPSCEKEIQRIERKDSHIAGVFKYTKNKSEYPVYNNSDIKFFSDASDALEAQKEAMRNAKKFIFLEYFAIEDTTSFHGILDILEQKVKEGVEVRIMFDDFGSVTFIDRSFVKKMERLGIKCRDFSPFIPIFHVFMDHRDHRKITVIDGNIAFTGGYNLADEYFNVIQPRGHWKDSGVRITGEATKSLTAMFLETWNAINTKKDVKDNYDEYLKCAPYFAHEDCFIQPYADSPIDTVHVGEDVYLSIINSAEKYLYICTPYLIIMDEMKKALCLAAERGVDVRIITPGIPDKKFTYRCTRSTYTRLVGHGIKIFEYTPGFNHAKQVVCDDKIATCGTVNFDYRSFYHHYENGVIMYNCKAVEDLKKDFDETFPKCREVSEFYKNKNTSFHRIYFGFIRLFATLM